MEQGKPDLQHSTALLVQRDRLEVIADSVEEGPAVLLLEALTKRKINTFPETKDSVKIWCCQGVKIQNNFFKFLKTHVCSPTLPILSL